MWTRREFLARGAALAGLAATPAGLFGQGRERLPNGSASKGMMTAATKTAVEQALAFLANNQHADGSWGTLHHKGNIAITSLGALALMSGGHQPGRGKYGRHVSRALEYVLRQQQNVPKGYLFNREGILNGLHGPMYGHGFGTLFLAEVSGMVHKKELRNRLRGAVRDATDLIVRSQNREGGWRYRPDSTDADISVAICQIMALRAARNAGFSVPKSTVNRCIEYVKACQNQDGGFRYTIQPQPSGFARSAAGVVALYSAGVYKGDVVTKGLQYLMTFKPGANNQNFNRINRGFVEYQMHYFYGHYYAAQAMWTAGGKYWKEWFPAIRDELLTNTDRKRENHWYDRICSHYGTAMACIILQIPNNYLPILQK
jgi:prenyltransferase beta subunit